MYIPGVIINNLFHSLNEAGISYVLIKNIGGELPDKLSVAKDIDILVFPESKELFSSIMSENGYTMITHPFGRETGWVFAYGVDDFQFWQKAEDGYILNIDITYAMCCRSMQPNIWIPLDQVINASVKENKVFDKSNGWWVVDEKNMLIYMLARCVFDKRNFPQEYINEIEKRKYLLSDEYVKDALRLVFFAFTPKLITLIQQGSYHSIVKEHITFKEY